MSSGDSPRGKLSLFWDTFSVLTARERLIAVGLVGLALINVILETLGFGAVFAVLTVIVGEPETRHTLPFIGRLDFGTDTKNTLFSLTLLLGVFLVKHVFTLFSGWVQLSFLGRITTRLSRHLFEVTLNKPYSFFTQHGSPELISRIQNASLISSGVVGPITTLLVDSLVGLSLLGLMMVVEPQATIFVLALFLVFGFTFQRYTRRYLGAWGAAQVHHRQRALHELQEGIFGNKELRIYGRLQTVVSSYVRQMTGMAHTNRAFLTLQMVPRAALEVLAILGLSLLIMTLSAQGRSSTEILPVLGLFAAGAFRIAPSVNRILNAVQQIQFAVPAISGLSSDLRSPQIQMQVDNTDRLSKFQSLEWNDVSFSYDAASIPVLSSVSLKIEAGDVIGVVGGSGAGKSTFVDLCLGLYPPTFGTILLNGHEVDTRLSDWHQMVGYVPQQVYLSDSSVKANVCLGLPDDQIDNERLLLSLGMAQLGEWIEHLEDGFEALVGENGARLSGGQQQRIGIARALYNLPQVLFFDEATSALDTDTENALIDSIDLLKSKFTIVIVTHREGPLRLCNKVLSLANGVAKWR